MDPPCPKPDMSKYARMKKMKLADAAVRNKMKQEKIDSYWVRDFFGELQPMVGGGGKPVEPPSPKPNMGKYARMKKMKLPDAAIRNKMKQKKVDLYWVRDFFGEPQPMIGDESAAKPMEPPCQKPDMSKYARMKKMKLPDAAVRNKMKKDKVDKYWIRDYFGEPQPMIGAAKKKKRENKSKMKALHWRKKSDCDWHKTIWCNVTADSTRHFDEETHKEVERVFSLVSGKKKKKKKSENGKPVKQTEITLIDGKRSFSMVVGLRGFTKLGLTDIKIRNALLTLDTTKLNLDCLENLEKFAPTNDELNELRNFKGDRSKLARGEKFVDTLTCLTDLKLRLKLWKFKIKFRMEVVDVEQNIFLVHAALQQLQESKKLARFLEICLNMGNLVNEGTNRGNAKGLKIQSIDRFAALKSFDGKLNMIMFIMQFIEKNNREEFEGFPYKLIEKCTAAKRIEGKFIRDSVNGMRESLKNIERKIIRANRSLDELKEQFSAKVGSVFKLFRRISRATSIESIHALQRLRMRSSTTSLNDIRAACDVEESDQKVNFRSSLSSDFNAFLLKNVVKYRWITVDGKRKKQKRVKRSKAIKTIQTLKRGKSNAKKCSHSKPKPKKQSKGKADGVISLSGASAAITKDKPPKDKFSPMMTGFHTMANNKVEGLNRSYDQLRVYSEKTAVYFGEPDDTEWEELFAMFLEFFGQITKAMDRNRKLKKESEKIRKGGKRGSMKKRGLKKKKNRKSGDVEPPVNILDEIRMKAQIGTLKPSKIKNDVIEVDDKPKRKRSRKRKKKVNGGSF